MLRSVLPASLRPVPLRESEIASVSDSEGHLPWRMPQLRNFCAVYQVGDVPHAATCDHRDGCRVSHRFDQVDVDPFAVPSRSTDVNRISPAPRRSPSIAHSTTSRPVCSRPPSQKASQRPFESDLASMDSTMHCAQASLQPRTQYSDRGSRPLMATSRRRATVPLHPPPSDPAAGCDRNEDPFGRSFYDFQQLPAVVKTGNGIHVEYFVDILIVICGREWFGSPSFRLLPSEYF